MKLRHPLQEKASSDPACFRPLGLSTAPANRHNSLFKTKTELRLVVGAGKQARSNDGPSHKGWRSFVSPVGEHIIIFFYFIRSWLHRAVVIIHPTFLKQQKAETWVSIKIMFGVIISWKDDCFFAAWSEFLNRIKATWKGTYNIQHECNFHFRIDAIRSPVKVNGL